MTFFYKTTELATLLSVTPATVRQFARNPANDFPAPVFVGKRLMLWPKPAIDAWLNEKTRASMAKG